MKPARKEMLVNEIIESQTCGSKRVHTLLGQTLERLPGRIIRWIQDSDLYFCTPSDRLGEFIPVAGRMIANLIVLDGRLADEDDSVACFIVAHLIAQVYVHEFSLHRESDEACKAAAEQMVVDWGFRIPRYDTVQPLGSHVAADGLQ